MELREVGFFTAVCYAGPPKTVTQAQWWVEKVDDYFHLGGRKAAILSGHIKGDRQDVVFYDVPSSSARLRKSSPTAPSFSPSSCSLQSGTCDRNRMFSVEERNVNIVANQQPSQVVSEFEQKIRGLGEIDVAKTVIKIQTLSRSYLARKELVRKLTIIKLEFLLNLTI